MSRRFIVSVAALALLTLLAGAPVVGAATPAANETATPTTAPATASSTPATTATQGPAPTQTPTAAASEPATASEPSAVGGGGEFSLEELRDPGPRQGNAPPSIRMGDTEKRMFWLVYWPANNLFANVGSAESGDYMPENHTLGRDKIHIRTWTYVDLDATIHVVYWNKGTRTVERENGTVAVPVAENIRHETHDVTFERGRPTVALDAPTHTNGKRVTMWVEGYDWARWTFYHKSIATTQSVDISSVGDYLSRVILDFLLWIVLGGFAAGYSCKRALDKAKIGPQYGFTPWIIGLSVVTAIGSVVFYRSITSLVVNARIVLAAYVVAIISIIMLETYSNGDSKALLLRPTLEHAESPTGDLAYDMIDVEGEEITIVRAVDGTVSVVRPGFLPFLARVFGKTARLKNIEQLRTRVPFKNSRWSELFVADPEAEELIHYTPEGWGLDFPELSRETAPTYLMVALGVMIAGAAIHYGAANPAVVVAVTAAGLLTWGATPVEGVAYVEPAPVHLRSAFGTMLQYAEDVDDAKRLDEVKEQLDSERVQKQRDVDEKVAKHDRTLVEEMLDPDNEVPAAVEREEFVDDEVTRHRREESEGAVADGGEPDGDE